MQRKFSISYDKRIDDLFIYLNGRRSSASVEIGDIILDMDSEGKIVGIEIQNASKLLGKVSGVKIMKSDLEKISGALVEISKIQDSLIIKILIKTNQGKEIISPIIVPC